VIDRRTTNELGPERGNNPRASPNSDPYRFRLEGREGLLAERL
jgi:hypothetical protein